MRERTSANSPHSIAVLLAVSLSVSAAQAQSPSEATPGLTTPAQSVGLYVFPQKGQDAQTQQHDEGSCYSAARTASGVDPRNLAPVPVQAQTSQGGGVRGAAGGAAGGAAIGAIAGDAGKGAAIGAVVGVVHGRRQERRANAQAQEQASQQVAAGQQQQMTSFKRAMTACLESRNYSVK
jgi:hypothetical protein